MRVLVTGANGHVGYVLVQHLLAHGYEVRASVRDASDPARTKRVSALGAEVVEADLLRSETLARAAAGMDAVFQVAATYELLPKHGGDALIRDSVEGGVNMLKAAKAAGVRRVVFTSSTVAVGPGRHDDPPRDETRWNEDRQVPYFVAKVEGERRAWAYARENNLDMVAILPSGIIGPGFVRKTPSVDIVENIRKGIFRMGVMRGNFPLVDVRDVAVAHRLALENAAASGRYIVVHDDNPSFAEFVELERSVDPRVPKAGPVLPDFMLPMMPLYDWFSHVAFGTARTLTQELNASLRGRFWKLSNARATRELGWRPTIPLARSVKDTFDVLDARA